MLELLRLRVRALVKLIEKSRRVVVYTDFADQLGEPGPIEIQGLTIGNTFERFRAKARVYLRAHEDHVLVCGTRPSKRVESSFHEPRHDEVVRTRRDDAEAPAR